MSASRSAVLSATLIGASAATILFAGCSTSRLPQTDSLGTSCAELLAEARGLVASGQTSDGQLDWTLDEMSYRCDAEYDAFVEEAARDISGGTGDLGQVGSGPSGFLPWSDAIGRVGSVQYVCGPLVNSGTSQDDVFLNLGLGYPAVGRFTIVLWDVGAVEEIPAGTTLCTTGAITNYQGTAQIELSDPAAVEVWE